MNEFEKSLEIRVQKLVEADNYKPLKPKAIAKKLKLDEDDRRPLKKAIKRLIKKGVLAWGPKHLVLKAQKKGKDEGKRQDEAIGIFRRNASGFGFVTPEGSTATDRSEDVYISKQKTLDAADGDRVKIRTSRRRQGAEVRISGRIIEVLDRRTNQFVGTYRESNGYGFVVVDGGVFESGILVGDAGAKNCRIDDKVVIEMVNFPSPHEEGEGVIVEVLGDRGTPGVDTLTVIREFGLPEEFPESVLEDARAQAEKFDESIPEARTDFTTKTVITIDPKTARDFDDAISLERIENDHWLLGVHIADVSHFVPYRSEIDREAYQRATSVYLPDRVIPMIPEIISNNLASLQPNRIRYCMTAMIEFNPEGIPIATDLHRGVIKSAHRFNYEEIDEYLEDDKPWKEKLTPEVFELVRNMHTLAMMMRRRRMDRGALELTIPDVKIDLDEDGKVAGAHIEKNTESHQVIEEFMLAANEAVAQRLSDEKLHLLRRIHEKPSEMKTRDLTKFVRQLGIDCENLEDRHELKRIIELSNDMPEKHAIHFSILRSFQKAVYSPRELGHYALASDHYCHFTSPIRRYPDLVIHRMVGDLVDGKRPDSNFDRLAGLGQHCSNLEQRAEQAERELKKLKLLNYFADKVGHEMSAVITGVEPFGIFAQGVEIPAEGLIPIANLPNDSYDYDRTARVLSGYAEENQFRLGDLIGVRVSRVDTDRREMEFELTDLRGSKRKGGTLGSRSDKKGGGKKGSRGKSSGDAAASGKRKDGKGGKKGKPRKGK